MTEDLQLVAALVSVGTALFVLGSLAIFLWRTSGGPGAPDGRTSRIVIGVLAVWYGVALAAGYWGDLSFTIFLPFALVPIAAGTALSFTTPLKTLLARVPAHWMVFLQVYRVAGGIFLYVYYAGDEALSRGFALNAGWGDVLTGVLAIPVGLLVWRRTRGHGLALILWSLLGIGDLILAPISAWIYGAQDLVTFPLNSIPLFLGPPLGILLHVVTLRIYFLRVDTSSPGA